MMKKVNQDPFSNGSDHRTKKVYKESQKSNNVNIMNTPEVIYLQVCGECHDNDCDNCNFDDLAEVTWCKDRINDNDVAYFSEEHVRVTVFAYLQGLSEFAQSTYGVNISAGTITENIMGKLKGDNNS